MSTQFTQHIFNTIVTVVTDLHVLVRVAVRAPPLCVGGEVGGTLVAPAPALGYLLARGEGVVAETVGRHHHTERRLHLHRSTLQPQPRVAHTGDRVRELDLDDLPQVLSVGVKASLFGSAEHSEDVLGGVGVDQHGKAVVGLLSSAKFLLEIRYTFLCEFTNF